MAATVDALTIINKASQILGDASQTYWSQAELLDWLNDGQAEIALLIPNASTTTVPYQLVAGAKQIAPSDSVRIVEFVRNLGVTGTVAGTAIRQIDRKAMDRFHPSWASDTVSPIVLHVMYSPEDDNSTFYVWPPQPATPSYIEIIYEQQPALIPDLNVGTKITLDDFYQNPLIDYVLYRAFGRGTESQINYQRSQDHFKQFADVLNVKFNADITDSHSRSVR